MKFASKITLSIVILSLIAVPVLVFVTFHSARTVLKKSIAQNYLEIAQHQMISIDRALYVAYRDIQMIAEDEALQDLMETRKKNEGGIPQRIFNEWEERAFLTGPWDQLTLIDSEGLILMSTDNEIVGKQIEEFQTSSTAYYHSMKGQMYYSDLVQPVKSGRPTVLFAAPIRSKWGQSYVKGVVIGHFAWPVVTQMLDEIAPPAMAHLFNSEGMIIASPSAYADKTLRPGHIGYEQVNKVSEAMLSVSSLQNGLFGYRGSDWKLLLEVPLANALAPVNLLARKVAAFAVLVMLVLVAVLYFVGRLLARPVEKLTKTMEKVSLGNLTVQADVITKDELGELASSFNKMTETLQKTTVSRDYVDNILKTMPGSLIVINPDAVIVSVNQASLDLLGYEEKELIGQPSAIVFDEESFFQEMGIDGLIRKGSIANVEKTYLCKDGTRIPVLFSGSVMSDGEGKVQNIICVATDIRERRAHEEKLRRTSRALSAIHASNMHLTQSVDEQQLFEGVCRTIVEKAGYRFVWVGLIQQDKGKGIEPVAWAGEEQGYISALKQCWQVDGQASCSVATALETGTQCLEMDIRSESDSFLWRQEAIKRGYSAVIRFPLVLEEVTFGVLSIYSAEINAFEPEEISLLQELADDIAYGVMALRTQQKHQKAEEKIIHQAFHDSLTELPNRTKAMQLLDHAIMQIRQQGGAAAVLFVNLDNFKLVNDTLGHAAGDELLREVAARVKRVIRANDVVARQGGDEFVVLLTRYASMGIETTLSQEVVIVAQRILEEMQAPILVMGQEAYISASIGISLFPDDAEQAAEVIQNANSAMYQAKELGRGNYQFFSREISERQKEKMSLATMLHKAIDRQEFLLHYQPVVDLATGKMIGVEALIRWEQENGNLIPPADFLPVAEDTGLILPIGEWVIEEACHQAKAWADKGISLQMAINLSPRQMWHGDIGCEALKIINKTGVSKDLLEFEVTESSMVKETERTEKALEYFKAKGIKIALDDFGTGYSSLDRLKHLPFHKLKIDKSFVDGIPNNEDDMAIVSATVKMAQSLGLSSLAEGIETAEQWRFLKKLGCDFGQGYYFSKPVPAAEIEHLCQQTQHRMAETVLDTEYGDD
ncbi:EAL domain-containing protein [Photobacterium sp. SDRW27]|uniref:EAL domain-containing protein n=1 Tax=Photobacterium obscurum TaxID=2829490 RepID=UPI0022438F56|nr:EAL domain-containing protein [Photobacterium obscurum]MCW8331378.1 EAL domain-containing protein [Photobacterium obscurum]